MPPPIDPTHLMAQMVKLEAWAIFLNDETILGKEVALIRLRSRLGAEGLLSSDLANLIEHVQKGSSDKPELEKQLLDSASSKDNA